MLDALLAYGGLLFGALLAATILPASSEAALAGLLATGAYEPAALLAVATVGNTAGAAINWLLGRCLLHLQHRRWFPLKPSQFARSRSWFQRYGAWTLLFSWVPVVGDPLTVAAGALRMRFWPFLAIVFVGKAARYVLVGGVTLWWMAA
ncbi:MAG TPA: YqaA family protein [Candidatus Competibacteraceae bacterium]|nr:YqaA family protein [Candidatus Competibacteraceae bacterium]